MNKAKENMNKEDKKFLADLAKDEYKTFGDLQIGDIIFRYEKGGDRFVARRVLRIEEYKETVHIEYAHDSWTSMTIAVPKAESTSLDGIFNIFFFSCKTAVEEFLLQMERDERERHWNEEKKIQKLREQYESVRL